MKILHLILTVTFLMVSVTSHAEGFVWRKEGKATADTDFQKSRNDFGAMLALTDDKKFFEDWYKPDPPRITALTTATRMVPVHITVFFVGAGSNADGEAHVTCDVTVRKPDGSVYAEQMGLIATKGRKAPDPRMLQLAQQRMAVVIEPHDPAGTYTAEVTVTDKVKKVDLRLKERFTVSK